MSFLSQSLHSLFFFLSIHGHYSCKIANFTSDTEKFARHTARTPFSLSFLPISKLMSAHKRQAVKGSISVGGGKRQQHQFTTIACEPSAVV
jgi:hypothetical protein